MSIIHDPKNPEHRRPFGAAECCSNVTLACLSDQEEIVLRLWCDEWEKCLPTERRDNFFSVSFTVPENGCVLFYSFCANAEATGARQITVYHRAAVPDWYKNAVVYQIFPDRFARHSGWTPRQPSPLRGTHRFLIDDWDTPPFYPRAEDQSVVAWPFWGGTLRGIGEKLPYLRSLGVTCLYLNPIFSAASNHRYDTADYFTIDPLLGTEEDFRSLCDACHAEGMRVVLDGVFNHTGADSVYFDKFGNYGTGEQYRQWFRFGEQYTHGYECWWDVPDLPNVEENEPSFREFICGENGVVRYWLRQGADGWRLDVADELPDDFIRDIRRAAKAEKPDAVLLGEVWEDASNKVSYGVRRAYFQGEELDSTMHYPFRTIALDFLLSRCGAGEAVRHLETLQENYPRENYYAALNLPGSHDRERMLTLFHGERRLVELISAMSFVLPGVPCIYYGDEAGMAGGKDPYNRGSFPWGREDEDLIAHYRTLAALYERYPVLKDGECSFFAPDEETLACRRWNGEGAFTAFFDRRSQTWRTEIEGF